MTTKTINYSWGLLTVLIVCTEISAQNLVPNGSFENSVNLVYKDPPSAFLHLDNWYPANYYTVDSASGGTPDLFDNRNRWPPSDPPNFWNIMSGAYEGDYNVGIANHLRFDGYTLPEALAVRLTQPLEKNAYYHVSLYTRNKGIWRYRDSIPLLCVPEEHKNMQVLLHPDSIYVTIDGQGKDSYSNAINEVTLSSPFLEGHGVRDWFAIGTCFKANGDEQFFGITTSQGRITADPPCVILDEHWDVFYVYYYDVDNIVLTRLPDYLLFTDTICQGRSRELNIAEMANLPIMQQPVIFELPGGIMDSLMSVSSAGTYEITAFTDCNEIPITVEISEKDCAPRIYVPNAFSPNGDGVNDALIALVTTELPILAYEFKIFNRWGSLVFKTMDPGEGWEGSLNGQEVEPGVYGWQLLYTVEDFENGPTQYKESGDLTLMR